MVLPVGRCFGGRPATEPFTFCREFWERHVGHEVIMYGVIIGATRAPGEGFRSLYTLNEEFIDSLPSDDDHPWVDGSIFALPGPYPNGTYRRQAIHFGLTIKDDPNDLDSFMETWLTKFENILAQLYWFSTRLHVIRDFSLSCEYLWLPTDEAMAGLFDDPPKATSRWERTVSYKQQQPPHRA